MADKILVLLVDDTETILNLGVRILDRAGMAVEKAISGEQAVEIFERMADQIDIVILDMSMPGMDGEETFNALKKIRSDARVVISSGYSESEATDRMAENGLAGFLQKPYRPQEMVNKVNEILH